MLRRTRRFVFASLHRGRKGVELLDISSPTLKHLTIEELENINYLVLDVPNLLTFK